ncbi:LysR family transcriptional regulator, partial [Escherichia coli]|nr:LysR family transcriptional regulator [Escherichia coli]
AADRETVARRGQDADELAFALSRISFDPNASLGARRCSDKAGRTKWVIWVLQIMARVQLSELTAFVAVAERLSFTKAARELGMALPTIS